MKDGDQKVKGAVVTDKNADIVCDDISMEEACRVVMSRISNTDAGFIPSCTVTAIRELLKLVPSNMFNYASCGGAVE